MLLVMRNKRRHSTGFGYIGSGNKTSVFNRKPRKVFSEIKDRLNFESHKKFQIKFNNEKIPDVERYIIKKKIKSEDKIKIIKVTLLTLLILVILIVLFRELILYIFKQEMLVD